MYIDFTFIQVNLLIYTSNNFEKKGVLRISHILSDLNFEIKNSFLLKMYICSQIIL